MVNFAGNFSYESSTAKDVEFQMKLSATTSFEGEIDLPDPLGTYDVSGSLDFDTFTETHSLGNIVMDAGSFSMLVPTTKAGPFSMAPRPIGNGKDQTIGVTEIRAKKIDMKCTEVPLSNPLGVYLGNSIPFENPMDPNDVLIEETKMAELNSNNISTPSMTMDKIQVLNIVIPSVTTGPLEIRTDTDMTVKTSKKMFGSGVTRHGDAEDAKIKGSITLSIKEVSMKIKGGLEFKNIKGSVTTDSATSGKFDMNLAIKGIKIKGLNICGMNIPEVVMEF
jgi:hypothetical protein